MAKINISGVQAYSNGSYQELEFLALGWRTYNQFLALMRGLIRGGLFEDLR